MALLKQFYFPIQLSRQQQRQLRIQPTRSRQPHHTKLIHHHIRHIRIRQQREQQQRQQDQQQRQNSILHQN